MSSFIADASDRILACRGGLWQDPSFEKCPELLLLQVAGIQIRGKFQRIAQIPIIVIIPNTNNTKDTNDRNSL